MSDVAYAELYAGIVLARDPALEERRVQRLLAVNKIEVRMPGSLELAKKSGRMYGKYLEQRGEGVKRILPDFLVGASAELYASKLVTWNPQDFKGFLKIDVSTPSEA
jgi:predicted nucleic acid-binding protein